MKKFYKPEVWHHEEETFALVMLTILYTTLLSIFYPVNLQHSGFFCLSVLMIKVPVNNFSDMSRRFPVFLG